MEAERTRFQKVILIILAVMVVLFGVLTGISRAHKGVLFEGELLDVSVSAGQTVCSGKVHGDPVTITVTPERDSVTTVEFVIGDWLHDTCRVEYPLEPIQTNRGDAVPGVRILKNGNLLFEGGYNENEDYGWYEPDGTWSTIGAFGFTTSGGDPWSGYKTTAPDVMRFARGPELTARGSWAPYFLMVLLTLLLMLDVAFPTALFYMRHCFAVRDPEPSDDYLVMQKISWVIWPFLLLIGYIWALRQFP